MRLRIANSLLLSVMLMAGVAGVCAQQQDPPPPPAQRPAFRRPGGFTGHKGIPGASGETMGNAMRKGGPPPDGGRPMHNQFPPFFDQLAKMPAEDREKALASDPHFQRMPPDRQAKVRENLERFANMTPEQRQLLRDRFVIVNSMPPENRDRVREVFPRWRQLPEDRRQAMREELRTLTAMTPADREKYFADPEFQKTHSPREQRLLKDLSGLVR